MTEGFNELTSFWINAIRELSERDFEDTKINYELSQAIAHLKKARKLYNRPERPDTCKGFIGDCDRTPSKYHDLKDSWYCTVCYNEMYQHYAS